MSKNKQPVRIGRYLFDVNGGRVIEDNETKHRDAMTIIVNKNDVSEFVPEMMRSMAEAIESGKDLVIPLHGTLLKDE